MGSEKTLAVLGASLAFLAVAFGAFGAHGLRSRLSPEDLDIFETGVRYQMYHSLALFAVAWLVTRYPESAALPLAGWLFLMGILVFSGSLYLLVLTDTRWLGAVTPLGGLALLGGWLALVWGVARG